MTPTLDNELDMKIALILSKFDTDTGRAWDYRDKNMFDEIKIVNSEAKQAIKSLLREVELEARIDALKWAIAPDGVANLYERCRVELDNLLGSK